MEKQWTYFSDPGTRRERVAVFNQLICSICQFSQSESNYQAKKALGTTDIELGGRLWKQTGNREMPVNGRATDRQERRDMRAKKREGYWAKRSSLSFSLSSFLCLSTAPLFLFVPLTLPPSLQISIPSTHFSNFLFFAPTFYPPLKLTPFYPTLHTSLFLIHLSFSPTHYAYYSLSNSTSARISIATTLSKKTPSVSPHRTLSLISRLIGDIPLWVLQPKSIVVLPVSFLSVLFSDH